MPSLKIVLDTNVLVSAFVFKGACGRIFDWCVEYADNYTSEWLLKETARVLETKLNLSKAETERVIGILTNEVSFTQITPTSPLPTICRDSDDNNVLQLAESVNADYIVTGDKDLLVLNKFNNSQIVSPAQFLTIIESL